mmetsp:Transcript_35179/g.57399  ORF Transcript_35179/g.57399 Transcript_35179/m.57399 type:complete len:103 (+) Transcript_35179:80-388(+)
MSPLWIATLQTSLPVHYHQTICCARDALVAKEDGQPPSPSPSRPGIQPPAFKDKHAFPFVRATRGIGPVVDLGRTSCVWNGFRMRQNGQTMCWGGSHPPETP